MPVKRRRTAARKWSEDEPRAELHERRRQRILQEAARCFNRRGYQGTSIEDIASRLNVSVAALYYYFTSKEELLLECHRMALRIADEGLRAADAAGGDAADRLTAALRHYIEHVTDELKGCVAVLDEGSMSRGHYREIVRRRDAYEHAIRRLVAEGIDADVFVRYEPKLIAFAILGAVNWIPKWYRSDGTFAPQQIAETLSAYLVRGLARTAPSPGGDRP